MLTLDPLHLVVLLGAVQGVFLTFALAARRRNRTANRLLAAAMLAFSISLTTGVYHNAQLEAQFPHFFGIGYPMPFLFGPLVYLYSAAAADRSRRMQPRDWLHFVPFLAVVLWGLPVYLRDGAGKLALYAQLRAGEQTPLTAIADPLKFVSGLGYGVATMLLLRRHREHVKDSYSNTERVTLRWLLWLGASAVGIWAVATILDLLKAFAIADVAWAEDIIDLSVAVLVCVIGYIGLRQPEVFHYHTAEFAIPAGLTAIGQASALLPDALTATETEAELETQLPRYQHSGLSEAESKRIKQRLLALMDRDRPWANSALTLADLAALISTTPHKLSEVLNAEIGETFYDFVNGYRVRDVQRRITAGEAETRKILALAMDAGFASKSTFNVVFRKHTSQTPSEYRGSATG